MKSYVLAEAMEHEMKLVQLGGKVTFINSKMCYVSFDVEGIIIEYSYNINSKGKVFLERIKPYPLPINAYEDEEHVIEIIKIDLEQFYAASQSHNMADFITINQQFHNTLKRFEDLFLYYNVPEATMVTIKSDLDRINQEILNCRNSAKRVYFEKEPDNL